MKELLPIGSVVMINKDNPEFVIICGSSYINKNSGIAYDYIIAPWPQGMEHTSLLRYCQHEEIERIISFGLVAKDEIAVRQSGAEELEKYRNS